MSGARAERKAAAPAGKNLPGHFDTVAFFFAARMVAQTQNVQMCCSNMLAQLVFAAEVNKFTILSQRVYIYLMLLYAAH